jgi:hypothetical protein
MAEQSHPVSSNQNSNQSPNQSAQAEAKDPHTLEQQDFQPESGAVDDQEEKQARRRHSIGTERVKLTPGEATEEA